MDTFPTFAEAKTAADALGLKVGGTFRDTTPAYFLHDADDTDEQIRDAAFLVRHGRPMNEYERLVLGAAERMRQPA